HHWLELFHGRPLKNDRKTGDRRSVYVPRASSSITGCMVPKTMKRMLNDESVDDGLIARFVLAMPPRKRKCWSNVVVDPQTEKEYDDLIGRLLELEWDKKEGVEQPLAVDLNEAAQERWIEFYNEFAGVQNEAEGELAAAFSKLEAYAARFALLHHVVTWTIKTAQGMPLPPFEQVELESVEAGVALALWFAAEDRRIYQVIHETEEDEVDRLLVEYIQGRGGSITVKQLQQNSRRCPTSDEAKKALDRLVEAEIGHW